MPEIEKNTSAINEYYNAFADFLKTGELNAITQFISEESQEISSSYLQIYRNGFLKTSIEALRSNFPVVSKTLPPDEFTHIAKNFIDVYPPRTGTLTGYGAEFPEFLQHIEQLKQQTTEKTPTISFFQDLAKLDYAWLTSLYSPKSAALSAQRVQQLNEKEVDIADVKTKLNDDCEVVSLQNSAFNLWQKIKTNELNIDYNDGINYLNQLDIQQAPASILFWQSNHQVIARQLDVEEILFIKSISSGNTIGEAATKTIEKYPSADIATIFSNLLTHEILTEI